MFGIPLFPEQASTVAGRVDALYLFLIAVAVFFSVLIAGLVVYFAVRYRRRAPDDVGKAAHGALSLEIAWTVLPFLLTMVIFVWGASIFFAARRAPDETINIYVVGKQWMWKFQHLDGQREINELHVPVGRAVRLVMTSEDVIHSFYVPAFRMKFDVLPGRYTTAWFRPTKPGKYHLFCAEYCGTNHSAMTGWVHVMEPAEYDSWLGGGAAQGSLASRGEQLFQDLACSNCHKLNEQGRCPNLTNLYGATVKLSDGSTAKFDEAYIRESILFPNAKTVAGFEPIMPTFQGQVAEEGILELIEYIKSLSPKPVAATSPNQPTRTEPARH